MIDFITLVVMIMFLIFAVDIILVAEDEKNKI